MEDSKLPRIIVSTSEDGWTNEDIQEIRPFISELAETVEERRGSLVRKSTLTMPWIIFSFVIVSIGRGFLQRMGEDLYESFKAYLKNKMDKHIEDNDVHHTTVEFHFIVKDTNLEFRLDYGKHPNGYNNIRNFGNAIDEIFKTLDSLELKEGNTRERFVFNDENSEWELQE